MQQVAKGSTLSHLMQIIKSHNYPVWENLVLSFSLGAKHVLW